MIYVRYAMQEQETVHVVHIVMQMVCCTCSFFFFNYQVKVRIRMWPRRQRPEGQVSFIVILTLQVKQFTVKQENVSPGPTCFIH